MVIDSFIIKEVFFMRVINMKLMEARVWIRKYLVILSDEEEFNGDEINGKKVMRLISIPIQMLIHDVEQILNNVLIIKILKNKKECELKLFIIIKNRKLYINEVWTH